MPCAQPGTSVAISPLIILRIALATMVYSAGVAMLDTFRTDAAVVVTNLGFAVADLRADRETTAQQKCEERCEEFHRRVIAGQ